MMVATDTLTQERMDKISILVVDDHQANLNVLEALLDGPDRKIFCALSGEEALRILLQEDVAAILLDVSMPAMDGYETARLIRARERTRDIPIIFLTAFHRDEVDVQKGYALGAVDYLFRPIAPNVVKTKVNCFVALAKRRAFGGAYQDGSPGGRILIVDDDPALLEALPVSLQLRLPSVHIDLCESPEETVSRLATTSYSAVICDFKMPAIDGFTVLREAHRLQPLTPVLLMTGHGDITFTSRAVDAGAFDCLQKPFQGEFVALAIKRAIEAYRLRRHRMDMQLFMKELATYTTELESLTLIMAREIDQATTLEGTHLDKLKSFMEQMLVLAQSKTHIVRKMTQSV